MATDELEAGAGRPDRRGDLQAILQPGGMWHAHSRDEIFAALDASDDGLSEAEAARRLASFGANRLPQAAARGPLLRFAVQFHNLLIYVLLGAAALAAVLGHWTDAAVVLGVVVANAIMGFIQEGRAERALEAIARMIDPQAVVRRDGRRLHVGAEQIVPGDLVLIEAGDRVPADLRLLGAHSLRIDEAALTGESVPVDKGVDAVAEQAPLGDRRSMAFSGTYVAAGHGSGIAVATGRASELGRISAMLGEVETLKTPLVRQMEGFARQLTLVILLVAGLAFAFATGARDYSIGEAFMAVVGLAVAAIPEGLPAIMTITLAIGVQRMAARNAIIRRLPAIETLGSVSVICSDKTGTLTRNEMTAQSLVTAEQVLDVADGITAEDQVPPASRSRPLSETLSAAVLCNDASLQRSEDGWAIDGDPMEGALLVLAVEAGLDPEVVRRERRRIDEIPFDADLRFMATLNEGVADGPAILLKGAPERVFEMAGFELHADGQHPIDRTRWQDAADALAARGQRVLAFARGQPGPMRTLTQDALGDEVVLLGLIGFIDPPRAEAIAAIADCRTAGIRVVMITGDHVVTAREIARQLGLAEAPKALCGADVDRFDKDALGESVQETVVYARTTPAHKLRLVTALQEHGLTVAMTGDGVNDAPALKRANVGVAMGKKGTEAAKSAAEVVLADDNFASIVAAVREGRTVYDNLMKVISWTLPTNGGEALTLLAALAAGIALPVTPVQILWINMITAIALGLTLAFEPIEPGTMRRPPRPADQPILGAGLLWQIGYVSALFVAGAFGVFYWAEANGLDIATARTLVVNTIVAMEIFYLFSVRYVHGTSFTWQGVLGTPAVLLGVAAVAVAQLAFTYLPAMQTVFATEPLGVREWLAAIGVGVVLLVVVEIEKSQRRRWRRSGPFRPTAD